MKQIKQLQRLLGKKTMENELLKEAVCPCCFRISRAQLHAMVSRSKYWQDRRRRRMSDDTEALARIHTVIGALPTYGYRRVWALLRRQSET